MKLLHFFTILCVLTGTVCLCTNNKAPLPTPHTRTIPTVIAKAPESIQRELTTILHRAGLATLTVPVYLSQDTTMAVTITSDGTRALYMHPLLLEKEYARIRFFLFTHEIGHIAYATHKDRYSLPNYPDMSEEHKEELFCDQFGITYIAQTAAEKKELMHGALAFCNWCTHGIDITHTNNHPTPALRIAHLQNLEHTVEVV